MRPQVRELGDQLYDREVALFRKFRGKLSCVLPLNHPLKYLHRNLVWQSNTLALLDSSMNNSQRELALGAAAGCSASFRLRRSEEHVFSYDRDTRKCRRRIPEEIVVKASSLVRDIEKRY